MKAKHKATTKPAAKPSAKKKTAGQPVLKVKKGGRAPDPTKEQKRRAAMPPSDILKECGVKAGRIEALMLDEEKAKNELKRIRSSIRRLTTDLIAEVRHPEQGHLALSEPDEPKAGKGRKKKTGEPVLDNGPAPADAEPAATPDLAKVVDEARANPGRGKGHAAGDPDADGPFGG